MASPPAFDKYNFQQEYTVALDVGSRATLTDGVTAKPSFVYWDVKPY